MFFVIGRAENVPVMPTAALARRMPRQDNDRGEAYQVQVLEGEKVAERTVHVGLMDRTRAEIRQGLTIGERLVMPQAATEQGQQRSRGSRRMPRL
jgi:macrolide-specific efflux system membrane fusion protein